MFLHPRPRADSDGRAGADGDVLAGRRPAQDQCPHLVGDVLDAGEALEPRRLDVVLVFRFGEGIAPVLDEETDGCVSLILDDVYLTRAERINSETGKCEKAVGETQVGKGGSGQGSVREPGT